MTRNALVFLAGALAGGGLIYCALAVFFPTVFPEDFKALIGLSALVGAVVAKSLAKLLEAKKPSAPAESGNPSSAKTKA